ncbi:hypothetical protein RF11_16057 [Thelohanellus kitauei]|uniref:Uncharacterized protein n=1 Tax=Thelohanellus kitauei TaxID=669202 RepID=A0A0C2IJT3_THEKT|nr:hypothetical protein RF11_16057 [Thelohanellus kitauei]
MSLVRVYDDLKIWIEGEFIRVIGSRLLLIKTEKGELIGDQNQVKARFPSNDNREGSTEDCARTGANGYSGTTKICKAKSKKSQVSPRRGKMTCVNISRC